jgi:hypothetical protein
MGVLDAGESSACDRLTKEHLSQLELALGVLQRGALLTEAVWAAAAEHALNAMDELAAGQPGPPAATILRALEAPNMPWILLAFVGEQLLELLPEEPASEHAPKPAVQQAIWTVNYVANLFLRDSDEQDQAELWEIFRELGMAHAVLEADEKARASAAKRAQSQGRQRTDDAHAWYRAMGVHFGPRIARSVKQTGHISRDRTALLIEKDWPAGGFRQQRVCPEHSTLLTAIRYLESEGLLDRGQSKRPAPSTRAAPQLR